MTLDTDYTASEKTTRLRGRVTACAVLMLVNQFAPLAAADDFFCYHAPDLNCDRVVDGQDLSLLLGSWGTGDRTIDFDGSCSVDGGDLAYLLASWGALPDPPTLSEVEFDNESVQFCMGSDSLEATIDGSLYIDPMTSDQFGFINVSLQDGVYVSMEYQQSSLVMMSGMSKVGIYGSDPATDPYIYVNGYPWAPGDVIDDLHGDIMDHGMDPWAWEDYSQMMMAQLLVHETTAYEQNLIAVQMAGAGGPGFWCKTACIAAGAAITTAATAGCLVLTGSCAVGSTVTFGGLAIPCTGLIALCAGGVFAGGAAAYELALASWGN